MTAAAVTAAGDIRRRRTWAWITAALVLAYFGATYGIAHGTIYTQGLISQAMIFAVLAVSLDLVAGMTGLYSLGHAGLFALGAYTTALLGHAGWNIYLLLPISIIGAGLVGAVLGTLSLRVSGLYFAIMTFIFSLVVTVILQDFAFTGGLNGTPGPIYPSLPSWAIFLGNPLVWTIAVVLLIAVTIVWSIRASAMYPVLLAIRDAEPFAAANGVRTAAIKIGVFALSAGLAGMAGWAFSFSGYISPQQFTWTTSVNILVMVIFGGINTRLGPIIGAAFVSAFPIVVHIDPLVQELIYGLVFVAIIVFFPGGVMGLVMLVIHRLTRRRSGPPLAAAAAGDTAPVGHVEVEATSSPPRRTGSEEYALEATGITFSYVKGVKAVEEVDFRVRRGSVHGLIGPNGSGKSTLVNLVAGRLRPDEGTIVANGRRIDRLDAATRPAHGIRRTFQSAVLVRDLSVRENVTIGLYHRTPNVAGRSLVWPLLPGALRDHREMRGAADTALQTAGLAASWNGARVADVPHGVEQLTQLAAACVGEPSILILDEPLAGLSTREIEQVSEILNDLRERGVTVIVVEHQTHFIFSMCDDVTVLAAGRLVVSGPAEQVRSNERVREVYLGQ